MAGASTDDLEEIAEGKSSARDRREAGVSSARQAKRMLGRKRNVKTTVKKAKAQGYH